jgi:hypothetical protein
MGTNPRKKMTKHFQKMYSFAYGNVKIQTDAYQQKRTTLLVALSPVKNQKMDLSTPV